MRKYVALYDTHCGFEKKLKGNVYVNSLTHNKAAIGAVIKFIADYQPDELILGGDQMDAGEIAHWNKSKPRLVEGFRFKDTLDITNSDLLQPLEDVLPSHCKKVWLRGNHEKWLDDLLDGHPALEGLLGIEEYLNLHTRGWKCLSYGELYKIGKCFFCHGDRLGSRHHADAALAYYRRNIRYGHFHTKQEAVDKQAWDRPNDRHTAKCIPCLRDLNPGWMHNQSHNWLNGFLVGAVQNNGNFTDMVVEMTNNQFIYNGVLYA